MSIRKVDESYSQVEPWELDDWQKEVSDTAIFLNRAGFPAVVNHDFTVVKIYGRDMREQDEYCREMNGKIKSAETKK